MEENLKFVKIGRRVCKREHILLAVENISCKTKWSTNTHELTDKTLPKLKLT